MYWNSPLLLITCLLSMVFAVAGKAANQPNMSHMTCAEILELGSVTTFDFEADSREQLFSSILPSWKSGSGKAVIDFLSTHPGLTDLNFDQVYADSAGVSEGFSLLSHTRMVFTTLKEQLPLFGFPKLENKELAANLESLFVFMIAIHDIGKTQSVAAWTENNGGKSPRRGEFKLATARQHEFTVPIALDVMERFGFGEAEKKLIAALIDNDLIGEVATMQKTSEQAFKEVGEAAARSGVSLSTYFALKKLFFIVDAASYPALRYGRNFGERWQEPVFVEDHEGRLHARSSAVYELSNLVRKADK